jgi:Nif-specific regulatory protein
VAGEFRGMPEHKFRVYQEPCYYNNGLYHICRFENITGYENEITRLRREKEAVSQERDKMESALRRQQHLDRFIGSSGSTRSVKETLNTLSQSAATLLLVGETGTGKEVLANLFHDLSPRKDKPFVKLDCSTLPPSLIESELFGYEPGAFTGAQKTHIGKFEQANGGALFLDEIGNLSLETQAKLLGVLEDQRITRLGGAKPIQLSINIIAASNRNLEALIREKRFRDDLYYRLNRFKIEIPRLRERTDDIPALCQEFIRQANREYGKSVKGISEDGYVKLYQHDWPGNVRELKNVIFKAVLFSKSAQIHPGNLDLTAESSGPERTPARKKGDRITLERLKEALTEAEGNIFAVAEILDVTRATVYNRMKRYGLDPDGFRPVSK